MSRRHGDTGCAVRRRITGNSAYVVMLLLLSAWQTSLAQGKPDPCTWNTQALQRAEKSALIDIPPEQLSVDPRVLSGGLPSPRLSSTTTALGGSESYRTLQETIDHQAHKIPTIPDGGLNVPVLKPNDTRKFAGITCPVVDHCSMPGMTDADADRLRFLIRAQLQSNRTMLAMFDKNDTSTCLRTRVSYYATSINVP